jgi:two-component system response regulator NreC
LSEIIRVVIIDDHQLFRDGLKSIFSTEEDIELVGEAADATVGLEIVRKTLPDVLLLDISVPGVSGLEICRQIAMSHPEIRIIILTMHKNDAYVKSAFSTGAMGYVLKHSAVDELTTAIRSVKSGKKYISSELTEGILHEYVTKTEEDTKANLVSELTERENEIVRLIVQGWNTNKIADALHISPATVKTHRAQIMRKLGIHKNIELVKYAVKKGIIELD